MVFLLIFCDLRMIDYIFIFRNLPPELATILIAMIPIAELRVSLPIALTVYDFSFLEAYVLAVIGNLIPVFFIAWLIGPVSDWLMKHFRLAQVFFEWLFDRTRKKMTHKYQRYGLWALAIFVAIPLPMTGAWTGALAGWLFGIPPIKIVRYVALGVLIAGIIVGVLTLSAQDLYTKLII